MSTQPADEPYEDRPIFPSENGPILLDDIAAELGVDLDKEGPDGDDDRG